LSSRAMALIGLRMMPTFPSPPLKFRTVGFPQYGYKASLSGGTCQTNSRAKVDSRHTLEESPVCLHPSRTRRPRSLVSAVSPLPGRFARRCACGSCRTTPGVLGSDASCAVSRPPCLLRPHPPVSQARDDFSAEPVIRRAFAVRERLGDPRDLPYFHCRAVHTCHRPYAGGSVTLSRCSCASRCQASSVAKRVATHDLRLCQLYSTGRAFRRCIVRVRLRPACLPRPPDWLRADGIT
jgi:hypothetical protein